MNFEEYSLEINKNIPKLLDIDTYLAILYKGNNLARYDIVNKIGIILLYGTDVFDIKTREEWFICGRNVKDKSKFINVIVPNYSSKYIDSETQEIVDIAEFTNDEFKKAIELGIVYKKNELEGVSVQKLYDIKNTYNLNKENKYNIPKPILGIDRLFEIIKYFTNITVEASDEITYFSKKENHLFLAKDTYDNMVMKLVGILVNYFVEDDKLNRYIRETLRNTERELTNDELELLKESIEYSINSLFNVNSNNDIIVVLKNRKVTGYEELIDILTLSDYITFKVVELLEYSDNSYITDATNNILLIKKSEKLLDIMQASSIQSQMKGV